MITQLTKEKLEMSPENLINASPIKKPQCLSPQTHSVIIQEGCQ